MNQEWEKLFQQMDEWTRSVDRFMQHMHQIADTQQCVPSFALNPCQPAVNIYESEAAVIVLVELAGIRIEDVTIQVEPYRLMIQGQRPAMIPETVQALHQMEIWSGSFAFQVPLPVMVDPEQAQADYQAGFLKICLPKQGAAEHPPMSTRIQVQEEP